MADKLNPKDRKIYDMLVRVGTSNSTRAQVKRDRPSGKCRLETGVSLCRFEHLSRDEFDAVIKDLQEVLRDAYRCDEIYYTDARFCARPFDPVQPDRGTDGAFFLEWKK